VKKLLVGLLFCASCASGPKLISRSTLNGEANSGVVVAEVLTDALERADEFCNGSRVKVNDQHTEIHKMPVWDGLFKEWKYVGTNVWVVNFNCVSTKVLL